MKISALKPGPEVNCLLDLRVCFVNIITMSVNDDFELGKR